MPRHREQERLAVQREQAQRRPGDDRGGPRDVAQERDLPNVRTRSKGAQVLAPTGHLHLSIDDHVEEVADISLSYQDLVGPDLHGGHVRHHAFHRGSRERREEGDLRAAPCSRDGTRDEDRKSTRLNSSHITISYAVFCLKKKKKKNIYAYNY